MEDLTGRPRLVVLSGADEADRDGANPTPLSGVMELDEVEEHRSLLCDRYDECLDLAYRRRWQSWTCVHCRRFELAPVYRALRSAHEGALRPMA